MIAERFANNPNYRQYEELLIQLHHLFCVDKEDSEEADALRDEMDAPCLRLSSEEADRLGGLSGDLYMLQDDEVFAVAKDDQAEGARLRIRKAMEDRNWPELLETLRHRPVGLSNAFVAYQRFRAYAGLGHWLAASEFISYCLDRATGDPHALLLEYLDCMYQAGRSAEALRRVARENPAELSDIPWFLSFIGILQEVSSEFDAPDRDEMFRHAILGIQEMLDHPELDAFISPIQLVSILGSYALCLAGLGKHDESARQLELARQASDPHDAWTQFFLIEIERKLFPTGDELSERISPAIREYLSHAGDGIVPGQQVQEVLG